MYLVRPLDFFHAQDHQSNRKQLCEFIDDIEWSKVDEIPGEKQSSKQGRGVAIVRHDEVVNTRERNEKQIDMFKANI